MKRPLQISMFFLIATAASTTVVAQSSDSKPQCDKAAIQWVLPGHFQDAEARVKKENRILIIKGLGFGLDEVGATCATKGDW